MTMNELFSLALAWVAGLLLGTIFFGGLWWTVRMSVTAQRPALLFFASWLLRMSIALAGFYFVGRAGLWQRLLACMIGFIMARLIMQWRTQPPADKRPQQVPEANHAP